MNAVDLEKYLEGIEELPTPNFVVRRIIQLVSDPNTTVKQVQDAISMDPSMSAKVLKLANSAYYALPKKVSKLSEAIMILGFKTVRNLAMSIFTKESYFSQPIPQVDERRLWRHLVLTAMACEVVSEILSYPNKEETFMVGLLHDLGKIVMGMLNPILLRKILEYARKSKVNFYDVEKELPIPHHGEMAAALFKVWGLSEITIESARNHHTPHRVEDENSRDIVYIVHVGNVIANIVDGGHDFNFSIVDIDLRVWEALNLTPRAFKTMIESVKNKQHLIEEFDTV